MSIAIISSDKVVFALAFGIAVLVGALIVVWSRPRRWPALWALLSLAVIAGTAVGAVAAFRASSPVTESGPAPVATSAAPTQTPPAPPASPPASSAPAPQCSPSGKDLHVTAHGVLFDTDCLAAPADTAFTITFTNKDIGIPHNIDILSANPATDPSANSLFTGDLVTGPDTKTYKVSALPAGTYFFHCDVHPAQMFGTFVVGG